MIELGSFVGGSALWFTDTLKLLDIPCDMYSMDIDLSQLDKKVLQLKPNNLTFLEGNNCAIEETFTSEFLSTLPHPWVVIEDAHANMDGVLRHFHQYMTKGDYLVVEDVCPNLAAGVGMGGVNDKQYREMGPATLLELRRFLKEYEILQCRQLHHRSVWVHGFKENDLNNIAANYMLVLIVSSEPFYQAATSLCPCCTYHRGCLAVSMCQ